MTQEKLIELIKTFPEEIAKENFMFSPSSAAILERYKAHFKEVLKPKEDDKDSRLQFGLWPNTGHT